jgi:hypothetical protein
MMFSVSEGVGMGLRPRSLRAPGGVNAVWTPQVFAPFPFATDLYCAGIRRRHGPARYASARCTATASGVVRRPIRRDRVWLPSSSAPRPRCDRRRGVLVLVLVVLEQGTHRFSELRRAIGGVSERMLAQTLQWLDAERVVGAGEAGGGIGD